MHMKITFYIYIYISRQHPRNVIVDVSDLVYIAIRGNKTYQINPETQILKCIFK